MQKKNKNTRGWGHDVRKKVHFSSIHSNLRLEILAHTIQVRIEVVEKLHSAYTDEGCLVGNIRRQNQM